jgi:CheY-like chemotaxis protein
VHEHGGEVSVQSQPGRGALFTVEFGAVAADLATSRPPSRPAAVPAPASRPTAALAAPQRILVVEDEPTVARLIGDVLAEEGYSVDAVLGSHAGLDLVRRRQYELLICDLQMPYLDGRGLYRELRRMDSPLSQRLVFVTGDMLQPRTVDFLENCGVPCLAKPFLVEELKELVRGALSKAAARDPAEAGRGVG